MQASDVVAVVAELILLAAACVVLLLEAFLRKAPGLQARGDEGKQESAAGQGGSAPEQPHSAAEQPHGTAGAGMATQGRAMGSTRLAGQGGLLTAMLAVTLAGLLGAAAVSVGLWGQSRSSFAGMLVLDDWAIFFKVLFAVAAALVVLVSPPYLEAHGRHLGEYYSLLLFAVIGMDLMVAARDFVLLYLSVELMAISSYLLAAFFRYRVRSNEASLKYLVTGSLASGILLYGISLVYGLTAQTGYAPSGTALASAAQSSTGVLFALALVGIGLAFKVSAVPFHMWTPDVYQGAPTPIAAFFSVGPKAAAFSALIAVFVTAFAGQFGEWGVLFLVLSILTMLAGNLYALVQTNVKRMLAYSSIAHAGYLLVGVAAMGMGKDAALGQAILVYLAAYTFMNLGAFGVLAYLKASVCRPFDYSLKSLAGLGRRSPWAAVLLSLFLISLLGIPGTAGFIAKFYVFGAAVWAGLWWLAVIGVVLSAVSAYYYLRVIIYMFFREPEVEYTVGQPISGGVAAALSISALATLVIGLAPSFLWEAVTRAFASLVS